MDHVIKEIKGCMDNNFYFAALALALTIPNVCASFEKMGKASGGDYADWCNRYVKPELDIDGWILYSLRCSFLHNISGDFYSEKAFNKYLNQGKESGEQRAQVFEFFFPHQDAERLVIYRHETEETVERMPCVSLMITSIIHGYENFVLANPGFSHEYDYLYFEG